MTYEIGLSSGTIEALSKLGGFSVEKVQEFFPYVVKQQVVEGYSNLIGLIVLIGVSVILSYKFKKLLKDDYDNFAVACGILACAFWGLSAIVFINFMSCGIGQILNPQYAAVMDIIKHIK